MIRDQKSLDYEPLTRRRPRLPGEADGETATPFSSFDDRFERGEEAVASPKTVADERVASTKSRDVWVARRGHAVSFVGLLVFTFLVYFRPYELSPSLAWLSKAALITAIITLIIFVPSQLGLENRITVRTREVNLALILLGFGLLSIPLATDKSLAWESFVEFFKVIVIFIVMVNVIRTIARLRTLLLLILFASTIVSVYAIKAYLVGDLAFGGTRIEGVLGNLFQNPNDLALHLVTFFPIVLTLALGARNRFSALMYLLTALSLIGGTVVTFSRGGFLGLIAVTASICWLLMRQNRVFVVLAALVLVGLLLVMAPSAYRERISTTGDDSATARTGELKRSLYITLRHPILGVGMNNFVVYSDTAHATHNAYTQVASEMGIPAAIVYVMFLVAALKRLRRIPHPKDVKSKSQRSLCYLALGIQAGLIGYMVTSFFASVAYLWYVYYLVAYAISVGRLAEIDHLERVSQYQ